MASPSTESFTMPTSSALDPSASSTVLVEPPSSISSLVGEKESVGTASSLSMEIISGGPTDMIASPPEGRRRRIAELVSRIVSTM